MDLERFGEIVSASVTSNTPVTAEEVASTLTNEELIQALEARGLTIGQSALEAAINPIEEAIVDPITGIELTPAQHEKAIRLKTAMAEKFSTDELELKPDDFGLVAVGEGLTRSLLVMLTTSNGIYHGSWYNIMSSKPDNVARYTIEVNGQEIDTRAGMTWEAYQALVTGDKYPVDRTDFGPWDTTWLTGSQTKGAGVPVGELEEYGPDLSLFDLDIDWDRVRFRPAAII